MDDNDNHLVSIEDLAEALWQMFAFGNEANRWDDKAKARWYPKAQRVLQLTYSVRLKRLGAPRG